jgi:hypothetical protein
MMSWVSTSYSLPGHVTSSVNMHLRYRHHPHHPHHHHHHHQYSSPLDHYRDHYHCLRHILITVIDTVLLPSSSDQQHLHHRHHLQPITTVLIISSSPSSPPTLSLLVDRSPPCPLRQTPSMPPLPLSLGFSLQYQSQRSHCPSGPPGYCGYRIPSNISRTNRMSRWSGRV